MNERPDVAARLRDTARRAGDRVAIRWRDETITYRDLDDRATAGAALLQQLGITRGDRVAIVLGNVPAFVEAHFAALRAGASVVPLNPDLTVRELEYLLADSGASVCVVSPTAASTVLTAARRIDTVGHVLVAGPGAAEEEPPTEDGPPAGIPDVGRWEQRIAAAPAYTEVDRQPSDVAAIVYTSGTSGRPRGAMLTRRNLHANQDQSLAGRFKVDEDDTVLVTLPLFHIYALNVGLGTCVRVGATIALVERFDPEGSLRTIANAGVTIVLGAPAMYVAWLETAAADRFDWSGVRLAVSGSAPLPTWVFHRFTDRFGVTIEEGYGLTEASPSVASNSMAPEPRSGSIGLPLPGLELRLVDEHGEDVDQGDPGEIWVRGPNVFQGYLHDPDATAATLTPEGWLRTGDIATRDGDGYLYLIDRRQDVILVSGFNVYPREIEQVLFEHPDVAECAVVGVPDIATGEAVKAFVVPASGDVTLTAADLDAFCREHLARYKCPSAFEVVRSLPHTASGKLRRIELRADDPR